MPREAPVWRASAILVAAGVALGVTHNWMGLRSHPAHGIPWTAVEPKLTTLENVIAADSAMGARPPTGLSRDSIVETGSSGGAASQAARAVEPRGAGAVSIRIPPPAVPPRAVPRAPESPTPAPRESAPPVSVPFIPETGQPMQIALATARDLFDAKAALFMDARDLSEYEAGHIPGAVRLTRDEALLDPNRIQALGERSRPIVTYCDGGRCEASRELAQVLVGAGYRRVLVYTGGFPGWAEAGNPVARGSQP